MSPGLPHLYFARRVYFEDDIPQGTTIHFHRTRGGSHARSCSVDRVHSIWDDHFTTAASATSAATTGDMPRRDGVFGREAYDQLVRENEYMRLQLRELQDTRDRAAQLHRDNMALQNEIVKLRRQAVISAPVIDEDSSRREAKLKRKNTRLEEEVEDLRAQVDQLKTEAAEWRRKYDKLADKHEGVKEKLRKTENDTAAAARLATVYRQNLGAFEQQKRELEEENAALKRERNFDDLLRRRPY
ncbi:hypothetical protein VTJ49DRAFT_5264 [Mycothermus thermophilus]|uniref:Uncharacterized protein n=1 Tax=Humicola insolens TaxID=85995 RepID=A0ABR3VN96_HUMIN